MCDWPLQTFSFSDRPVATVSLDLPALTRCMSDIWNACIIRLRHRHRPNVFRRSFAFDAVLRQFVLATPRQTGLAMAYDRFQAGLAPGDLTVVDTVGATVGPPAGAGSAAPLASESAPSSGGNASSKAVSSTLPVGEVDAAFAAGARAQAQPLVGSLGVSPNGAGDGDMPSSPSYASRSPTQPAKRAVLGTENETAGGASDSSPGEAAPPHSPDSVAEGVEEPRSEGEIAGGKKYGGEEDPCASTAAEEDMEGRMAREAESFDAVGKMEREEGAGGVPRMAAGGPVAIQSELVTASPTGSEVLSTHAEDLAKEEQPEETVQIRRKKRTIDEAGES